MRVSNLFLLVALLLVSSCSKVVKTAQHTEVDAKVASYPTVGDLKIAPQRISKSVSWKWNPFNTTSLAARKENIKADLIKEAGADILVEPEFVQRTSFGNLLGGSLTVSGYPAILDNFRVATPEDIVALRVAGTLSGNSSGDNVYLLLDQEDINGVVVGMPTNSSSSSASSTAVIPDENVTNAIMIAGLNAPANTEENVIPADPVNVASVNAGIDPSDPVAVAMANIGRLNGNASSSSAPAAKTSYVPASKATSSANVIPGPSSAVKSGVSPVVVSSAYDDPIAYDRIGKDRFLITMAREYYGNPNFWPYIYEENRVKFGHPDKIRPGSSVVVPNLKKYGVDPKNPADVEKAKNLARQIYARYGKNI